MPLLFSYGTLQQEDVQLTTFGRLLQGQGDELPGFAQSLVRIGEARIAEEGGRTHHVNAAFNGRDESRVPGTVFDVTDAELGAADRYERPAAYERTMVTLASGTRAWVYVHTASGRGLRDGGMMEFDVTLSIDVLERTPGTLSALLNGIDDAWARGTEGPDTFNPFDVVGHLIDGEETDWIQRARIILSKGPDRRFTPYDRFRHRTRNVGRSLESLLAEFAELRTRNLAELRSWSLAPEALDLPGEHPSLGPVTLRQLLAAWVVHDLGHIAQVARVMAKQYRHEAGPWIAFLPVLTDHEVPRS